MFTADEMRAEGLSDTDIERILARNEEIMKKRAAELPTKPEVTLHSFISNYFA
jgi:hypothetical protein